MAELEGLGVVGAGWVSTLSFTDGSSVPLAYFPISFITLVHRLGTQISLASLASPSRVVALISLILGEARLGLSSFLIIQVCFWGGACLYFIYVQKRLLSD